MEKNNNEFVVMSSEELENYEGAGLGSWWKKTTKKIRTSNRYKCAAYSWGMAGQVSGRGCGDAGVYGRGMGKNCY